MLAMPASAGAKTVTVTDREGDMGIPIYSGDQGSHEFGDPYSWCSGNCPLANADYLDMLTQWVSIKSGEITMGMTVASPIPTDGGLPQGVTEVRWAWYFYPSIEMPIGGGSNADIYAVYLTWNGVEFSAVLVDRTNSLPFALTYLDFTVDGNVMTVTTSLANIPVVAGWFCTTIICRDHPWPLDQYAPWGGWFNPDLTDVKGPLAIYWPWQAMP